MDRATSLLCYQLCIMEMITVLIWGRPTMEFASYLRQIELMRDKVPSFKRYPFHLGAIRGLEILPFHPKVTYIVGVYSLK